METDYQCYLLGCRSMAYEPLEEWRFRILKEEVSRRAAAPEAASNHSLIPAFVLEQLAALTAEGYKIAAGRDANGEEPGAAAAGVREPRVPPEPVLSASAACSLPPSDSPDTSFWRT